MGCFFSAHRHFLTPHGSITVEPLQLFCYSLTHWLQTRGSSWQVWSETRTSITFFEAILAQFLPLSTPLKGISWTKGHKMYLQAIPLHVLLGLASFFGMWAVDMVLGHHWNAKDPHFDILLLKLNVVVQICLKSESEFMSIEVWLHMRVSLLRYKKSQAWKRRIDNLRYIFKNSYDRRYKTEKTLDRLGGDIFKGNRQMTGVQNIYTMDYRLI